MASTPSINGIWRPLALHNLRVGRWRPHPLKIGKWRPQMANCVHSRQMASTTSINCKWRPQRLSKMAYRVLLSLKNGRSRLCTIARAPSPPCSAARSAAPRHLAHSASDGLTGRSVDSHWSVCRLPHAARAPDALAAPQKMRGVVDAICHLWRSRTPFAYAYCGRHLPFVDAICHLWTPLANFERVPTPSAYFERGWTPSAIYGGRVDAICHLWRAWTTFAILGRHMPI